jgi:mannosyltransferase OCH1-like enzyme
MEDPKKAEEAKKTMEKKVQETYQQMGTKASETMTIWADANQRVVTELVELGTATAKEGVKLYAEIQQSALETFRDNQAAAIRWQSAWQEAPKDPMGWYQRAIVSGVENAQKGFRFLEGNAQAVTRTAERLQACAEQAGKGIQETLTGVATKMKDVYSRS